MRRATEAFIRKVHPDSNTGKFRKLEITDHLTSDYEIVWRQTICLTTDHLTSEDHFSFS